jgi:hypothetical protein
MDLVEAGGAGRARASACCWRAPALNGWSGARQHMARACFGRTDIGTDARMGYQRSFGKIPCPQLFTVGKGPEGSGSEGQQTGSAARAHSQQRANEGMAILTRACGSSVQQTSMTDDRQTDDGQTAGALARSKQRDGRPYLHSWQLGAADG